MKRSGFKKPTHEEARQKAIEASNRRVQKLLSADLVVDTFVKPTWKRKPVPKGATFGLKRTPLSKKGKSDTALTKDRIQALVRAIVIIRDQGCILRNHRYCNGLLGVLGVVLQADHLITRSNGATFADTRLIVCVCKSCHGWKSLGDNNRKGEYDRLVKTILSPERVALWERAEEQSWKAKAQIDWRLEEMALEQELKKLSPDAQ